MKNFLFTALFVLVITLSQSVCCAQSPISPAQAAEQYYRTYLKLKIRGLPSDNQMKVLVPLITPDLKGLLVKAKESQAKYKQEHPDDKGPWADGDLFTSLFEGAQSFRLGPATWHGSKAEVQVYLAYREGGSTTRWSDGLILVRSKQRWLIWDILLKGEWTFKNGDSLRSVLSSD